MTPPPIVQVTALLSYTNEDLSLLVKWLNCKYLKVNSTKTQAMVLGFSNYNFDPSLDNSNIEIKDELKLLGVTIDSKLSYTTHIKNILGKIHAKAGALRRIRNFIDSKTAMRIYKAYILPHFDYCSPLFVGLSSTFLYT